MELRHYITFAVSFIVLQLFVYILNRTLYWLFSDKLSHKARRVIRLLTYGIANFVIILSITRVFSFRVGAFLLVCLLFVSFTSIACALIYRLLCRHVVQTSLNRTLRLIYPFALAGLVTFALYNAYVPTVRHYQVTLDKPLSPIRIGVASDLHLGKLFGAKQLDRLAQIMQQENVDLILLPGDIMDDNVEAYLNENMRPHLAKLQAPLGVYATMGNHDFFGAQQTIAEEIQRAGIHLLMDQSVTINHQFVIVGRNDNLYTQRLSTEALLQNVDTSLPIFLLDHRPDQILQHAKLPIDLQVSGHAHNGQIFPANIVTKMMYPLSYGYEKIGNGHFFVTSGYGFWGVPMRLGSQSEVFIIDVVGNNQ